MSNNEPLPVFASDVYGTNAVCERHGATQVTLRAHVRTSTVYDDGKCDQEMDERLACGCWCRVYYWRNGEGGVTRYLDEPPARTADDEAAFWRGDGREPETF